jgi:hypothetical protein
MREEGNGRYEGEEKEREVGRQRERREEGKGK